MNNLFNRELYTIFNKILTKFDFEIKNTHEI